MSTGNGGIMIQQQGSGSRPASTSVLNCKWTGENALKKAEREVKENTKPLPSKGHENDSVVEIEFREKNFIEIK